MVRRSVSQYHIFFTLLVEAGAEYITQFRKQVYSVSKIKKTPRVGFGPAIRKIWIRMFSLLLLNSDSVILTSTDKNI